MERNSYLCLATCMVALIHHSSSAQSVPAEGSAAIHRLLDARSKEIKLQFKNDPDVVHATSILERYLRDSDQLKQTIILPCPPAPAPSPAGSGSNKVIKIGTKDGWESLMSLEIDKTLPKLDGSQQLSAAQKDILTNVVAPEFARAGDDDKFRRIIRPRCPTSSPAPAGHRPDDIGTLRLK